MYGHSGTGQVFESVKELAISLSQFLKEWEKEEGGNFPESLTFWEEKGDQFRLLSVPAADEAGCGNRPGAWEQTLQAYANPANYQAGEWEAPDA